MCPRVCCNGNVDISVSVSDEKRGTHTQENGSAIHTSVCGGANVCGMSVVQVIERFQVQEETTVFPDCL